MRIIKRIINNSILKRLAKSKLLLNARQKGASLMETMVALGILGAIGIAYMQGLGTVASTSAKHDNRITAASLALSQVEELRAATYLSDGNYSVTIIPPSSYSIDIDVIQIEVEMQQLKVSVFRLNEPVLSLNMYKTDR